MKMIEIDGKMETVWRCRVLVSWRLAGIFPFGGGDWAESRRTGSLTADQVPRDHLLEILLTAEVWLCATGATAVAAGEVVAVDTVAGTVRLKSGAVVTAKISRREHFAGEAQFVQSERLIVAMSHGTCVRPPGAKGGRKQPRTRTRTRTKKLKVCGVCGWGHDAGKMIIVGAGESGGQPQAVQTLRAICKPRVVATAFGAVASAPLSCARRAGLIRVVSVRPKRRGVALPAAVHDARGWRW
ncbi:MAG: hypothetical protein P4N60_06630 [Verrucomicrobiae bacterium]|nr:hypothetical protein [Verrucomicrobiae bacterium]